MSSAPLPHVGPKPRRFVLRCEPAAQGSFVVEGSSLMDGIGDAMLPLAHACGGMGACGFCRVMILEGEENLSPVGGAEAEVLKTIHAREGERLACFARVYGDVRLTTSYW